MEVPDGETRGLFYALRGDVPFVVRLHTPTMLDVRLRRGRLNLHGWLADRVDRISSDRAHGLVAPTPLLVETLRPFGWLVGRDPEIIPYPFEPESFVGVAPPDPSSSVVLVVGRIEHRKGQDVLVEAVHLLREEGIHAEIVLAGEAFGEIGGVNAKAAVEVRAAELGVPCRFVGHVPYADLPELFARARVVAVPSRFESFSIAALEGVASGRPVVCSKTTGVASFVERWDAGTLVDPDDPRQLADALRPFLLSTELATDTGLRGRRALVHDLRPAEIAAQEARLYEAAIARAERRRVDPHGPAGG
jgi:glycosyltransferase involved in cell wall biosynthesis